VVGATATHAGGFQTQLLLVHISLEVDS